MGIAELFDIYQGKKVLVTGHTGFKGSWLSIWLHLLGADVVGISLDPHSNKDNFVLAKVSSFVKDYRVDIRDKQKLISIVQHEKPEIIFHLAAQPLVLESYQNPFDTFETNVMGTAAVLEAIRLTKEVKTGVFITTDKVYENQEWIWPYRETERLGGYDPYSASKGAAEVVIASYRNSFFNPDKYSEHGKAIASVRAGNVIGGGDWAENRIVPDCINALEQDRVIEVRSPLSVRPWQHVLEPLGGYLMLGAKMVIKPIDYCEAWNFGPEPENTINVGTLVDVLIAAYQKGSWQDTSNHEALHEAKLLSLDINKVKYKLNWKPVLNIDETVKMTVDWYRNYSTEDGFELCKRQIKYYCELWKSSRER